MNDLLDRKLKKLDHNIKYDQVTFNEARTKKAVLNAPKSETTPPSWFKKAAPLPLIAVAIILCFQLLQAPPSTDTHMASLSPEKNVTSDMKTPVFSEAKFLSGEGIQSTSTQPVKRSTMVRETYVLHNNHEFVQTGQTVQESQLKDVVGTAEIEPLSHDSYTHETKIYSIEGENPEKVIAIQSRRNTGIGSTSISKQGYFVFEMKTP
ncbi:hypothetical protein LCM20_18365 [Halobacillus litoralis]|uniref:hypothetical protein n=1 Tax=Halobacillus litoralis TaxID=45668 RepID=UPI001CD1D1DA|nr:hypothetical protein [Halobacillus litoralis]MCA0972566.1 hypothetical protein [Halobacillus litoralis]